MTHDEPLALAFNKGMVGKPADHARHDKDWQRGILTPTEVLQMVTRRGWAFTCSLKTNGARNRDNFDALNLAALDFDHAGIDQVTAHLLAALASFAYESSSSTPENPRCRLVFVLDNAQGYEQARQTIQALQHASRNLDPDTSTKDPVRCWYGAPGKEGRFIGGLLDRETIDRMIADLPTLTIAEVASAPAARPANTRNGWAATALSAELERVRAAGEGSRNDTLHRAACKVFEIANGGALDKETVRQELTAAATATGLTLNEITKTLNSAEQRTQGKARTPEPLQPANRHGSAYIPEEPNWLQDAPPVWDEAAMPAPANVAEAVDKMLKERPARKVSWTTAELLNAEFPDPTWIVPGMLPAGLASLAGRPKLGKSWLALQIAIAVGSGGMVFNKPIEQRRVLYFALEDGPRRLQKRLQQQQATGATAIQVEFDILPLANGGAATLLKAAESREYGLIVVDTFSKAAGRVDQMDLAATGELLGRIQRAAIDNDILILLVDHHRKSASNGNGDPIDDTMGSTGKSAPLDVAIGLYRERGKKDATLKITGRDIEEQEISIAFDPVTGCWQLIGTAQGVRIESVQSDILNALQELGGEATTSSMARFLNKNAGNISRELTELVTKCRVSKVGRKGKEVLYRLIE